jgi:hypothetical protein
VNPFVFIVGCPRSGTTLLRRLVDAHPRIAIAPEQHWVANWFEKRTCMNERGLVTEEMIPRLLEESRFMKLGLGRAQLQAMMDPTGETSYADFVTRIYDLYGAQRSKPFVGEKTPGYVRSIGVLHELWPQAKFVHLIRDGRDVSLSAMSWARSTKLARRFRTWMDDPVTTSALWWEWHVRLGRDAGRRLGPSLYHEVFYEALVDRADNQCSLLCDFLGVSYDPKMMTFHQGRMRPASGLDAKHAWLPPVKGLRNWKTEMSEAGVAMFEATAGSLLEELGYDRAVPDPPPGYPERASSVRLSFRDDVAARGSRLPEGQ